MSDHHEPATAVAVPSPSSAAVPASQSEFHIEFKSVLVDQENNTNALAQTTPDQDKITVPSSVHVEIHPAKKESSPSAIETPSPTPPPANVSRTEDYDLPKCDAPAISLPIKASNCTTLALSLPTSTLTAIPTCTQAGPTLPRASVIQVVRTYSVDSLLPHVLTPSLPASATTLVNCAASTSSDTPSTGFKVSVIPRNILKPAVVANVQLPSSSCTTNHQTRRASVDAIPAVIPEFQTGKIDAKKFPARHFDLKSIVIGSWKYEAKPGGIFAGKMSRLKVIFSQKKFIYEFELGDTPVIMALYKKEKQMASIEVPFSSVVGLNIPKENPNQLLIEVNSAPFTYLGKQELYSSSTGCALPTRYDTSHPVDLTNGQTVTVPYHQLNMCSTHLRTRLEEFDPRFRAMLRTPILMDPSKRLPQQSLVKPVKQKNAKENSTPSAAKRPRKQSGSSSSSSTEAACACTSGCYSQRCKCVKANGKCSSDCKCTACKNPLNVLGNYGVDVTAAKEDKCLMQNIFRINDLEKLLKEKKTSTPCCDVLMPLKDVCTGVIECPECQAEYQFSWCWFSLCDNECRPRNHCAICKQCGDYRDDHCFKCNKCYFAGSMGSFKCPCEERFSFVDSLSLFLNNFVDPGDVSDDEYY